MSGNSNSDFISHSSSIFIKCNGIFICRFEISFDYFTVGFSSNKNMAYDFKSFDCARSFLKFLDYLQPGFSKSCECEVI